MDASAQSSQGRATREAFVELPVMATAASSGVEESSGAMSVQAWLPNGVVVDVRGVELRQTVEPTD